MPGKVGQIASGIPKTFTENMVKPAGDQLAEAVEQGVSDTFGFSPLPAKPQPQKPPSQNPAQKADEERRKQNILRYFDTLKVNASDYKKKQEEALQMNKQKELEEKQKVHQLQAQKELIQKRQQQTQATHMFRAQRKGEIKIKTG